MFENASSLTLKVIVDSLKWCITLSDAAVTQSHFLLALLENPTFFAQSVKPDSKLVDSLLAKSTSIRTQEQQL